MEAGLTTGNVEHPFPEELHREIISKVSTLLFAPSGRAAEHARKIAQPHSAVFLTGNTCVDALTRIANGTSSNGSLRRSRSSRKRILVTAHRRENHGSRGEQIGGAIARLAAERADADVVFVGHNHPGLSPLSDMLRRSKRLTVLPPQGYREWLQLLSGCYFVISDSGGAQEEAPWLRKPVLVLRDETERPEVVETGASKLVGTDPQTIYESAVELLDDERLYRRMQPSRARYPYGRGNAAPQIVRHMMNWLRSDG